MNPPSVIMSIIFWTVAAMATVTLDLTAGLKECLPCEDLFSRLEVGPDGRLSQVVEMQQRGEPKSGTTVMWTWARTTLDETCKFLGSMYGSETCKLVNVNGQSTQLEFTPQVAGAVSRSCPCDTIQR